MGETWIPEEILLLYPTWRNFLEGHAGVQFIHRYIAYALVLFVVVIFYISQKVYLTSIQKKLFNCLLLVVLVQFILGVTTLIFHVPIVAAILHQGGAFFLFGTALFLIHRLK